MDNLSKLKQAYQRWNESKGADQHAWLGLMSDAVHIVSTGAESKALAFAQERHSKQQAIDYMTSILSDWRMEHWTPETFVGNGDTIAMFGNCGWTHKKTGKMADVQIAHLWQFKDGKATSLTEIFDTARAIAAAT
jgi:uncharacterized protein